MDQPTLTWPFTVAWPSPTSLTRLASIRRSMRGVGSHDALMTSIRPDDSSVMADSSEAPPTWGMNVVMNVF